MQSHLKATPTRNPKRVYDMTVGGSSGREESSTEILQRSKFEDEDHIVHWHRQMIQSMHSEIDYPRSHWPKIELTRDELELQLASYKKGFRLNLKKFRQLQSENSLLIKELKNITSIIKEQNEDRQKMMAEISTLQKEIKAKKAQPQQPVVQNNNETEFKKMKSELYQAGVVLECAEKEIK